jgi:hypothetical protein
VSAALWLACDPEVPNSAARSQWRQVDSWEEWELFGDTSDVRLSFPAKPDTWKRFMTFRPGMLADCLLLVSGVGGFNLSQLEDSRAGIDRPTPPRKFSDSLGPAGKLGKFIEAGQ